MIKAFAVALTTSNDRSSQVFLTDRGAAIKYLTIMEDLKMSVNGIEEQQTIRHGMKQKGQKAVRKQISERV